MKLHLCTGFLCEIICLCFLLIIRFYLFAIRFCFLFHFNCLLHAFACCKILYSLPRLEGVKLKIILISDMNVSVTPVSRRKKFQQLSRKEKALVVQERVNERISDKQIKQLVRQIAATHIRSGKRKNRKSTRKNPIFRTDAGSASRVPIDTHNAIANTVPGKNGMLKEYFRFLEQMVIPARSAEVVRAPCPTSFKSHCSKTNNVLSFSSDPNGLLRGRFSPNLSFMEVANLTQLSIAQQDVIMSKDGNQGRAFYHDSMGNYSGEAIAYDYFLNGVNMGVYFPLLGPDTDASCTVIIIADAIPTYLNLLAVNGTISQQGFSPGSGPNNYDVTFGAHTPFVAFSISWTSIIPSTQSSLVWEYSDATVPVADFSTLLVSYPLSLPDTIQTLRFTALSGLISYEGSDLDNKGSIAMAYVDPAWIPNSSDLYAAITSVPDKRNQNAVKFGNYGWWSPCNLQEEEPQKPDYWQTFPESSAIWWAIKGLDTAQQMKVEGTIIYEFYSPDQTYSHIPNPAKTPLFSSMYNWFNSVPHIFCNPSHEKSCDNVIKSIGGAMSKAVQNPLLLTLGLVSVV